ncbi:dimethylaniline monooxygenase [Gracilaria domingensis]|nr:dimethylaniline monooxygenase [Gracilaria domingensis]
MQNTGPVEKPPAKIGVIGGGIAGICAARECISRGLNVTIFEERSELGGIWTSENSPVFDALTTNTATFETCLSNISPPRTLPTSSLSQYDDLCFTREEMMDYIQIIIKNAPELLECAELSTKVISVKQTPSKTYDIFFLTHEAVLQQSEFDKVIIATGYFHTPFLPPPSELPGIDKHKDKIMHVQKYKNPSQLQGKRILVVGGSVSGCEAAGDMLASESSSEGPASVTLNARTMRFLFLKQHEGEVFMSKICTRFHGLRHLAGRLDNELYAKEMHTYFPQFLTNSDYPAPKPDGPIKVPFVPAWVPVNGKLYQACQQNKLEWKISPLECITETGVRFKDGTVGEYDVIVFSSGYKLNLSFLEEDVQRAIFADGVNLLDLYDYTFHPDVVNMAFVGMFPPGSAYTPMVDNQSRWVARVFSGDSQLPAFDEMRKGVQQYKQYRSSPNSRFVVVGYDILDVLAEHGGFEVDLAKYPELSKALLFGPMVPAQFRLFGEDKSKHAMEDTIRQFEAGGFKAGDNVVSLETYKELKTVCQILQEQGNCPPSLPGAIRNLVVSET